jgi:hypothetical protein
VIPRSKKSGHKRVKYAFPMSQDRILISFNAARRNAIHTLSIDITLEKVSVMGGSIISPLVTYHVFLVKSILMSNIT